MNEKLDRIIKGCEQAQQLRKSPRLKDYRGKLTVESRLIVCATNCLSELVTRYPHVIHIDCEVLRLDITLPDCGMLGFCFESGERAAVDHNGIPPWILNFEALADYGAQCAFCWLAGYLTNLVLLGCALPPS